MVSILRNVPDPERRIKAVMATRQMTSQEAIPVLKEALRDPADDVRLLAYSMLDAMEEEINATIRSLLVRLENEDPQQHQDLHERISNSYWELAYLGLAQGDVLRHVLNRSLHHLDQALNTSAGDPGLYIQRGRLLMNQKRWDEATDAFAAAIEKGVPETSVAPYLAEIAFEKREFNNVITFIGRLGPSVRKSERLAAIAAYWT
jgi:tetratricopeptide (TPR) repeat protein